MNSITSNDILVNIVDSKTYFINNEIDKSEFTEIVTPPLNALIKINEHVFRESGVQPLCICSLFFEWNFKSKRVKTPLVLIPLRFRKNKLKNEITFEKLTDESFFNPFLKTYFKQSYSIEIPVFELDEKFSDNFQSWISSIGLEGEIQHESHIANFHHHRFQIVKDLEGLIELEKIGDNVSQILGQEDVENNTKFNLTTTNLFPADNDQLTVFSEVELSNTVIQGPPGTGKSQVLSNVLGKIMHGNSTALVVSEKRVALEVLQKKLGQFQLDDFSFITTTETISNDFISSLKKVWDRMEKTKVVGITNLNLSEQYLDNLQLQLNLLSKNDLIGGVSFDQFKNLSKNYNLSKTDYTSDSPTISEWEKDLEIIEKIYVTKLPEIISFIPFDVYKNDLFETFDVKIEAWKTTIQELSVHFNITTVSEIHTAMKSAAVCQIIENESCKSYSLLLNPESKERRKYNQLKKKYVALQNRAKGVEDERNNWKLHPSKNESIGLLEAYTSGTYFTKRKAKKRMGIVVKSAFIEPISALKNWIQHLEIEDEKSKIKNDFLDLGIELIDTELPIIDAYISQLDKNDWAVYAQISKDDRRKLCEFHQPLHQLNTVLNTYFHFSNDTLLLDFFNRFSMYFEELIRTRPFVIQLTNASYRLLGKNATLEEYNATVFKSNWVKFESYFPELAKFKVEKLHAKIEKICSEQADESQLFSQQIVEKIQLKFQEFHQLLGTPAHKLSSDVKEKKQLLRKGKSILVKEFSKSRSHPSIRELMQTEAAIWINLLKPIWLSNPSQVAKCFPLTENLFDVVIFDEASQIPLPNALGSLHRGKRIIVAGDEQQMSPTSYFKSSAVETVDLLHQAGFYWKNVFLKHHYRSSHPQLIAFSNRYFYKNSLIAYPSGDAHQNPISLHYCSKAVYEERTNIEEAKVMARLIEVNLLEKKSIGIVAFSESQLKCIWEHLSSSTQQTVEDRIENGDLFFKTLENVQGEECDHLLISMGYGKNSMGEFKMQFGPLNQRTGPKRLNVLFSRAKKTIDFITSVTSTDFKISDNESINLLRYFLIQAEESVASVSEESQLAVFPHGLLPTIVQKSNGKEACFYSIYSTLSDANELVTFHRVLENRGWKVKYE